MCSHVCSVCYWLIGDVLLMYSGVVSLTYLISICGDTIEKSQAPDDGCINVRNMLNIEEVK